MKRVPVLIPEEYHKELRKLAFDDHTSMAVHIRKAIELYLQEHQYDYLQQEITRNSTSVLKEGCPENKTMSEEM